MKSLPRNLVKALTRPAQVPAELCRSATISLDVAAQELGTYLALCGFGLGVSEQLAGPMELVRQPGFLKVRQYRDAIYGLAKEPQGREPRVEPMHLHLPTLEADSLPGFSTC